jgi:hypothetical protein
LNDIQDIVVGPCITGHAERMAILKSDAWYALTDEELDEIVSCNDLPVLEG